MKIANNQSTHGSALIVTLLTAMLIGVTMAGYLRLVSSQNTSVMRSLAWNSGIPVLEAGVEEAMVYLYHNDITNSVNYGWALRSGPTGPLHFKRRQLDASYCEVNIIPVHPPVILATAYVPAPFSPSSPIFGVIGGGELIISQPPLPPGSEIYYPGKEIQPPLPEYRAPQYIRRTVRVTTRRDALWSKAMVADGAIDLMGNSIATDSFDSSDPNFSNNGKYDPNPNKTKAGGDVASNGALIYVGNADIKGKVATGPGGLTDVSKNGSVGSKSWVESGKSGIEPGYSADDMNIYFPPVEVPFAGGYSTPIAGNIGGTNYTYLMASGNYKLGGFKGTAYVAPGSTATLLVTDSAQIDRIVIAEGASLKFYMGGVSTQIAGNAIVNKDGLAVNFQYYGLPTNQKLSFSGNGAFTGVIYAPNTEFYFNGGGKDKMDFVGASVTKTVKMNGHFNFHYDEALKKTGPKGPYVLASWNEVEPGALY